MLPSDVNIRHGFLSANFSKLFLPQLTIIDLVKLYNFKFNVILFEYVFRPGSEGTVAFTVDNDRLVSNLMK